MIRETKMFSTSRYVSVLCFATPNCSVSFSALSKTWARNNVRYLLQKDGQLRSELFLQLWVPGKQGVIHQNLVRRETEITVILRLATAQYLHNICLNYAHTILCLSRYILLNTSPPGYSWTAVQSALFIRTNEPELCCLLFPNIKSTLESSHLITSLIGLISNRDSARSYYSQFITNKTLQCNELILPLGLKLNNKGLFHTCTPDGVRKVSSGRE